MSTELKFKLFLRPRMSTSIDPKRFYDVLKSLHKLLHLTVLFSNKDRAEF